MVEASGRVVIYLCLLIFSLQYSSIVFRLCSLWLDSQCSLFVVYRCSLIFNFQCSSIVLCRSLSMCDSRYSISIDSWCSLDFRRLIVYLSCLSVFFMFSLQWLCIVLGDAATMTMASKSHWQSDRRLSADKVTESYTCLEKYVISRVLMSQRLFEDTEFMLCKLEIRKQLL